MVKRIKQSILILLLVVSLLSTVVSAYNYWEYRCPDKGMVYKWGANTSAYNNYGQQWTNAAGEWNRRGCAFTYNSLASNLLSAQYNDEENVYGESYVISYDETGYWYKYITQVECSYNTNCPNLVGDIVVMKSTGVHELGHCLGLGDCWSGTAIMNEYRNRTLIFTPQQDDLNGVGDIYPSVNRIDNVISENDE